MVDLPPHLNANQSYFRRGKHIAPIKDAMEMIKYGLIALIELNDFKLMLYCV